MVENSGDTQGQVLTGAWPFLLAANCANQKDPSRRCGSAEMKEEAYLGPSLAVRTPLI